MRPLLVAQLAALSLGDYLCAETNHVPSDQARRAAAYLERRGK